MALDFSTLRLKSSPNQFLAAPEGICQADRPHRILADYPVGVGKLRAAFLEVVHAAPRVTVEDAASDGQLELVQRTKWLRFPDMITVEFYDRGRGRSNLAIYSRSRYGWSDLGANRARVESWLDELADRIRG